MAGRFSIEAVFKAVDKITRPVSRMQTRVSRFTRSMSGNFTKLNRNVGKFTDGVRKGALAVTAALAISAGAMANVISTGADFEQTLVSAAAKFPGEIRRGTAAFEELELAARKTGATTEFTASQSASALNFLAMAGFSASSSIAALPGVVDLATVAQVDLATATDIATDSLGAFNLLSDDAATNQKNLARVSDLLAKTSTSANTSIEQMFDAIKDGAPVAVAAGQSIETVSALIAVMADSGIKGSKAGTALKNIMLGISAPASKAAMTFRALGIETADSAGNVRDAVDIFDDFNRVVKDLPNSQKLQAFNNIFGRIPIAAAINLTNASRKTRDFRDELVIATDVTKTMATVIRDTVEGRIKSLASAIEGVKISIFSLNRGPLAEVIEKMTEWVRANESLIATKITEFLENLIVNFDDIVKTGKQILGVIVIMMGLSFALKIATLAAFILQTTMLLLNGVIFITKGLMIGVGIAAVGMSKMLAIVGISAAGLSKLLAGLRIVVLTLSIAFSLNPIGAFIAALVVLIGLATLVIKNWEPIKGFFIGLWEGLKSAVSAAVPFVVSAVELLVSLPDKIVSAWESVATFFSGLFGTIKGVISGIGNAMRRFGSFFGFTEEQLAPVVPGPAAAVSPIINVEPAVSNLVNQMPIVRGLAANDDSESQELDAGRPQIVSPQERIARSLEESRTTNESVVTIRDETGRAEQTSGTLGKGVNLQQSGAF